MSDTVAIISCSNLVKQYQDGRELVKVLKGAEFQVNSQDSIAIMGASGSGKSTLLHLLGGLDRPTSGTVEICGKNIHTVSEKQQGLIRNNYLGFVYQFHHLLPEMDSLENVAMPLLIRGEPVEIAESRAIELLERVGLANRLHHRLGQLSGGERQRVALARALVIEPKAVLADEPTGNLDAKTAAAMLDLLLEMNSTLDIAFVVVTHDINVAQRLQSQYLLADGVLTPG